MGKRVDDKEPPGNRWLTMIGIIAVIMITEWYCISTYYRYRGAPGGGPGFGPPPPGQAGMNQQPPPGGPPMGGAGGKGGAPTAEEHEKRLSQMAADGGFTEEQMKKIRQIAPPKSPQDMKRFQDELSKIASPEQIEKLKENTQKREPPAQGSQTDGLKGVLSTKDYGDLQDRFNARGKSPTGAPGMPGPGTGGGGGEGGPGQAKTQ